MEKLSKLIAMTTSILFLTACGGGGGGGGDAPPPPGSGSGGAKQIGALTAENADLVMFVAMTNVKGFYTSMQLKGAAELLLAGATLALAELNGGGNSGTDPCDTSGNTSWLHTDTDGDTNLSTGDTWNFTYNQCVKNGDTTNGSMTVNFRKMDPNLAKPAVDSDLEFVTNLTGTSFNGPYTFDGTYNWTANSADGITNTQVISSDAIVTTLDGEGDSTLKNFQVTVISNKNTKSETLDMNGDIIDPVLGAYQVSTQMALKGTDIPLLGGIDMYAEGEFTVKKGNASAKLIALNSKDIRILLDLDGDGVYEQNFDTTWEALTLKYLEFIGFPLPA